MSYLSKLLALGVVVGANNLAVALALGALGQEVRRRRVIVFFGMFSFVTPLLGYWLGEALAARLTRRLDWVGVSLLALLGLWTIRTAFRRSPSHASLAGKAASLRGLFALSIGISIDNMIIGFALDLERLGPVRVSAVIAAAAMIFTWAGMRFGGAARRRRERQTEFGAGALLLGLAAATWLGWI